MTDSPCDLAGLGVLVTRPANQCQGLCRAIAACGGRPLVFPALEILPPADPAPARRLLAEPWDLLIFISPNAVRFALELLGGASIPATARVAAVGEGTARALAAAGRVPDLIPERFDSEGLLALPELRAPASRRVLIVRGEGGRPLLGDVLRERGAEVHYAEVYRRALPQADPRPLLARWRADVQAVTVTSGEVLENLVRLLGESGRPLLTATPLVVVSERTAGRARELGFLTVVLAAGADDHSLAQALCRLAVGRGG